MEDVNRQEWTMCITTTQQQRVIFRSLAIILTKMIFPVSILPSNIWKLSEDTDDDRDDLDTNYTEIIHSDLSEILSYLICRY